MFTVIVPTHNRPSLLPRTLQSLAAQTYSDFQVIVVDDSSSYVPPYQDLLSLKGRYMYVIRSGTDGPAESRNVGLALARSEYVIFLDDDDTFEPQHLEMIAKKIDRTRNDIFFCDFQVRYEERSSSPPTALSTMPATIHDVTKDSVYVRNRIPNSCLVYPRSVVSECLFDTNLVIYEDWDFLLKCLDRHDLFHMPINSVMIHKSNPTTTENMRRGNSRDDLIVQTMLQLYRNYPAKNEATRLARFDLMKGAGVNVSIDLC